MTGLPKSFETERGSLYTYLSDGRTERVKYTGEKRPPNDITVFIPDFEILRKNMSRELLSQAGITDNSEDYERALIELVHNKGYNIRVIDQSGRILRTAQAMATAQGLFLAFEHEGDVRVYLPVSRVPQIGWSVLQMRKEGDSRIRHLGHRVTKIN
jgi:hypothetical protein